MTASSAKRTRNAYLFLAPSYLPLIGFLVAPMFAAVLLSFTKWDLLTPPKWIGLQNFAELLHDKNFFRSLGNTLYFIVGYLPLVYILGLAAALALNKKFRGSGWVRAAYFLPVITSWVIVALLWKWILNPQGGLVNSILSSVDGGPLL